MAKKDSPTEKENEEVTEDDMNSGPFAKYSK